MCETASYRVIRTRDHLEGSRMNAIETTGLVKVFKKQWALDRLDMSVRRGDVYGFVGKNGSGKSTTMRIVAGLVPATSGEVRVLGRRLKPCEAHPAVGALIEGPGVYPTLSALDNLMVKALALGLVDPRRESLALLEAVGLEESARTKAKRLSLGMRQRLGIALALLGHPDVLLLDEPLNGLDPEATRDIRSLIVRLNRERGVTVLVSSHVLDQLERICTRYGIIREGRLVAELTAEEVDAACASCLTLSCAEPPRALALLEQSLPGVTVTVLPDSSLRLEGPADARAVGQALAEAGIAVFYLHHTERDREGFFVGLMGGRGTEGDGAADEGAPRGGGRRA